MFGFVIICIASITFAQQPLGRLSKNKHNFNSTGNPFGAGSRHNINSVNNPHGIYGSPYSIKSANNPYAVNPPKLYDNQGNYRGRLSANPYLPDSTANEFGRYGSKHSPESINNPYGAGSPHKLDSPNNNFGTGLKIIGE